MDKRTLGKKDKKNTVAMMLATGVPIAKIAEDMEISRQTIHKWAKDEDFQVIIAKNKEIYASQTMNVLYGAVSEVCDAIIDIAKNSTNDRARLDACKYIMDNTVFKSDSANNFGNARNITVNNNTFNLDQLLDPEFVVKDQEDDKK